MFYRNFPITISRFFLAATLLVAFIAISGCDNSNDAGLLPTDNSVSEVPLGAAKTEASIAAAPSAGGAITGIAPPASVVPGALVSAVDIFAFHEQTNFVLPANILVDITQPGNYYGALADPLTPGVIPAGTVVNVDFYHQDTPGVAGVSLSGGVTYSPDKILGIIVLDATLDASDAILGVPGTAYPTGTANRGVEPYDVAAPPAGFDDHVRVGPTMEWLKIRWETANYPDQMRVITEVDEDQ